MEILPDKTRFLELSLQSPRVPICGQEMCLDIELSNLYRALYGGLKDTFLFESGKGPESIARYSFLGQSNKQSIAVTQNLGWINHNGHVSSAISSISQCINQMHFEQGANIAEYLPHFWGGWVGCIGYDMIRRFESLPNTGCNDLQLPDLYFFQVEKLFVYDHKTHILKYIVCPRIEGDAGLHYDFCVNELQQTWKNLYEKMGSFKTQNRSPSIPNSQKNLDFKSNMMPQQYASMVEAAKKYIEAGDIYQANLAQRFESDFDEDPFDLFLRLRTVNPSPFSGFLNFKDFSIVSSSPERLVKLENDMIESRPIAGTRPRGASLREDESLSKELLLNEKENAEHIMLVDLERNDLGRVCEYGSVHVTELMFLEQYSHVTHIVSNIVGKLLPQVSLEEILKAVFPGGTITGCPKIRCMEIIDELEPHTRGLYSGSFGYIGFAPYLDLNIIIRTIIIKDKKAYFHVGAGIVADSIPEKEYLETLDKAGAMKQALTL